MFDGSSDGLQGSKHLGERAGGIKGIVKEVLADLKSSYLVFG